MESDANDTLDDADVPLGRAALARSIERWGRDLGFADIGICRAASRNAVDAAEALQAEERLQQWLDAGYHGTMEYMARHGMRRARPAELVPGALTVIVARMPYLPAATAEGDDWIADSWAALGAPGHANVSRYAHGRDYHKVLRGRLQQLADRIADAIGPFGYRVFTDSAPLMEVELAQRAGVGWRGKHTLLLSRTGGSMFFLGEIVTDVPLPVTLAPPTDHCGTCTRCIDVCPTGAIVAARVLDARRCISYLTIENAGPIPVEFREAIGNRIYGCDDCQLVCPWNRYAERSPLPDFDARPLAHRTLVDVFAWNEEEFLRQTEGSAIRRIGHERWLRNVAVALGNALTAASGHDEREEIRGALTRRRGTASALVAEHIDWALAAH